MTGKKEMMRQLLKGVGWNGVASALGCSKSTVVRCAAAMREGRIDSDRLESMTGPEVSGLFADGRGKRGEECLEPGYARVCDQLAKIPRMTLALQWARCRDCNRATRSSSGRLGRATAMRSSVASTRLQHL